MSIFRPFKGFRPQKENVNKVASRPYDVLNSTEARKEVEGNPYSFLHVVKPEIDLPEGIDLHSQEVYNKAKTNLQKLITDGMFKQDEKPYYYIYAQTMKGKTQYGLVGCSGVEDYLNNVIKKHELTRPDKEEDRMKHVRVTNVNAEPVFFTYRDNAKIDAIVNEVVQSEPEYDFTTDDGFGHHFWVVNDENHIASIQNAFNDEVQYQYVADGHHRTAAAALVGQERKKNNVNHTGNEEYNFFLSVNFPASQLTIIDYNRVVKDLNGLSDSDFIEKLSRSFTVEEKGTEEYKPCCLHNYSMYIAGKWYSLTAKENTYKKDDPVGVLDVTILTNEVLEPLLDIKDLRRSERIEFVGGIRGLGELKTRVDSGEMKAAFALFPVTMDQLMDIADNNLIMPPKVTWFEPKLRSGLVFHDLE
ncbi:MAG: DUF1015 domain-containing protein [Bacteroidetes bacterium]|nr:MAG: DUF1015 domain-containing protein [Bacteroidota bacterium]